MPLLVALLALACHGPSSSDTGTCLPPDADPAPTWEGHPSDGWRWQKRGLLFPDSPAPATNEGDLSPTVVDAGGTLHLLFSRQVGYTHDLWASDSTDGLTWSDPVPVTGIPEGEGAYPGLLWDGSGYTLTWGSGTLRRSHSQDGLLFDAGETVLRPSDVGSFGALSLLYSDPVADGDALRLYFTGFDGAAFAIGVATLEGTALTVHPDPIWTQGAATDWHNSAVAAPTVIRTGSRWNLWFAGYDTSLTDPGPWRVGMTWGSDGLGFDAAPAVSLPLGESGPDAWSTRDPAVVPWDGGWLMIYTGMGDDGAYRLLSAFSDACVEDG